MPHATIGNAHRLAFAHLNLWRNPFGELSPDERARLAVTSREMDRWVAWLGRPGHALQLIGEQGRGKTTQLLALRARLPGASYLRVSDGRTRFPRAPLTLVDEAQRLPRWRRRWLLGRGASFALATHVDLARELARAGLRVRSVAVEGLSRTRLREVVDRRLEASRRRTGAVPRPSDRVLDRLLQRFGDDLRAIESCLYDVYQCLETTGEIGDGAL